MGTKTYAQLTAAVDVQDGDLLATYRGSSGPLKRATALLLKAYFQIGAFLADGSVPMTGAIVNEAGSAGAPSVTFTGTLDTGFYSPGVGKVAVAAAGIQRLFMTSAGGAMYAPVSALSSGYTVLKDDVGTLFTCTGTFTLALTAAVTLTSGHWFSINNTGTGIITIDPNGSETIDGRTTIIVYPGEGFWVVCDGSNFSTVGRSREVLISSNTVGGGGAASVEFLNGFTDTEIQSFRIDATTGGATAAATLRLSLKTGSYGTTNHYSSLGVINDPLVVGISQYVQNSTDSMRFSYDNSNCVCSAVITSNPTTALPDWSQVQINCVDSNICTLIGNGLVQCGGALVTGAKLAYSSGNINATSTFTLRGTR